MASSDIASKLNRYCREYDWSNQAEGMEDFLLNYFVGESDSEDEESDDQSESYDNQRVSSDNPLDTNDKPLQNDEIELPSTTTVENVHSENENDSDSGMKLLL